MLVNKPCARSIAQLVDLLMPMPVHAFARWGAKREHDGKPDGYRSRFVLGAGGGTALTRYFRATPGQCRR
jgi:hypothetical protein